MEQRFLALPADTLKRLVNACQGNPSVVASNVVTMHNVAAMVNVQNKCIGNTGGTGRDVVGPKC